MGHSEEKISTYWRTIRLEGTVAGLLVLGRSRAGREGIQHRLLILRGQIFVVNDSIIAGRSSASG